MQRSIVPFQTLPPVALYRLAARVLCLMALALTGMQAHAQMDWSQVAQRWADEALRSSGLAETSPLRLEVTVGSLDPHLRLAPCARAEPYLPTGGRLWGRTRLGLRCVEGATRWNVFLPVTVKAYGPAWVLAGNVASGAVLTAADAVQAEVDWAASHSPVLADPALWVGQVAAQPLQAGQALRQSMVKAPQLFTHGAQVRVQAQGPGFAITAAGQAMSAGAVGQTVRVRMTNGRIIQGIVLDDGTISAQL
ncbi:flagellar basal body P-ring formation chaperone FlgA [Simplicispira sedimenti]|uniref:flagellar basal body P-ring formation chaperone FlgA n=1 Tax=Simplicispira sedimenti TaxID=2919500 RepID=UPI003C12BED7